MSIGNNVPENFSPEELSLLKQREDHQFEYAMASLQATERDRNADREHSRISQKGGLIFFAGVGIIILVVTIVSLYLDKDDFLLQLAQYVVAAGGGGGIGYLWGYKRGSTKQE